MGGLVALINAKGEINAQTLVDMTQTIAHRGPDGEGFAQLSPQRAGPFDREEISEDSDYCVGLGHRRLSVIDVSDGGHQPMCDPNGRYWITYNGEIYNFLELRSELIELGHRFKTHSDTEVLLTAWTEWGKNCLDRLNGMFAFVIYDRKTNVVTAVRDRFGVKPLYMWPGPKGMLAFASEIKAFTVLDGWGPYVDGQAAYDFLVWGLNDHSRRTMFAKVEQIAPGTLAEIKMGKPPHLQKWYQVKPSRFTPKDFTLACEQFQDLFLKSVRLHLRADVPVGTSLSGGLDSSAITCATHALREEGGAVSRHVFSARSNLNASDDGDLIKAVVAKTDSESHEILADADGFLSNLDKMIWHYDEPFGSAQVFAQWKAYEAAGKSDVKVMLDGYGADETLLGNSAILGPHLAGFIKRGRIEDFKKEWAVQKSMSGQSSEGLRAMTMDNVLPDWAGGALRGLTGRSQATPNWVNIKQLDVKPGDPFAALGGRGKGVIMTSIAHLCALSLPMQLKWADRAAMAHGVENRAPFLDAELVEFILGAPISHKLHRGVSKRLLRDGLSDLLPETIVNQRDKKGFGAAEAFWATKEKPNDFYKFVEKSVGVSNGLLKPQALKVARNIASGSDPFHNRFIRMMTFGLWMERFGVKG
ncbi:asparagine synthase (glutamine-hydrolyzing) [Terasakiella sp. A23]|uniref:asparagine synthase (glutamine-hydrolyzing) n=1 Tax=Terasakiella sp. FCG-A23 TaxID=3080561 RepID=UPI002953C0DF|nr:asparagine synthase (glutamine-hydrolyzing) [Terasakiella sp. A23]MDV7340824.1 asparagine synthase (glutamine-hydrolyzing) [Terasakiella sp. A23]